MTKEELFARSKIKIAINISAIINIFVFPKRSTDLPRKYLPIKFPTKKKAENIPSTEGSTPRFKRRNGKNTKRAELASESSAPVVVAKIKRALERI